LSNQTEFVPSQQLIDTYRTDLHDGSDDSEPDIFNYSIPGESGKFFWSQKEDEFLTYPKSNIKITRNGSHYTLVDQNGIEYIFNVTENNAASQNVINTWKASAMVSASKKDSIRFTYTTENQLTKTLNASVKYQYLGGNTSNGFPSNSGSILNNNQTYAKLPDSIIFSNGYVKFNKNTTNREDLNGGRSLNNVSIYNSNNQLINKYQFTYRFKSGTGANGIGSACYGADSYSKKWMLLDKLEQVSSNSSEKLTHNFTYNESYFPACRYSAAQDYWGYYNGYDTNQNLIPSYFIVNTTSQVIGANRSVNPSKSDYGVLTKVTYPTGGYTEFDYENNIANNDDLFPEYITKSKALFGDDYQDVNGNILTLRSFESATFTIDIPSDPVLNNGNSQGGTHMTTTIEFPGCDISMYASNCALLKITGTTALNQQPYNKDLNQSQTPFHIPNGTYKLTASFDTSNNDYDDFIFIAEWDEIAPNQTGNKNVGGIRVKEVRSYANATATPITKKYKYITGFNSTTSSGEIFGTPNFSHSEVITFFKNAAQGGVSGTLLQRESSTANMQQISHSGSFVGYKKVFEETSDSNETGYTEYEFSHEMDGLLVLSSNFPYPPSESAEVNRGLLLHQKQYKKASSGFEMVQRKSMEYTSATFDNDTTLTKYASGFKWGSLKIIEAGNTTNFNIEAHRAQNLTLYFIVSDWKNLSKETNVSYHENDSITSITNYFYDNSDHLLRTRTETTDSRGNVLKSVISYADEMNNTTLLAQNRVAEPIKTENFNGMTKLSSQNTEYGTFAGSYVPFRIQTAKGGDPLEDRIRFHNYYNNGRIKEVSKKDGTHIVYIWGYDETLPIAKIENATFTDIPTSIYNDVIAKSNLDTSATGENNLRTALAALRNHANLSNAMITTYTYDPLVGVTSITDPRGQTVYYEYDGLNRLKEVKDAYGKIVGHNQYNYKN